jgi:putative glycosyltransferase
MTGLKHACGTYCFLIDSDLEEAPELLAEFWARLHDEDKDVVYGFQARRRGGWARRLTAAVAYRLFDWLLSVPIPTNHLTVRLMRRGCVDSLLLHGETQLVIGGLWVIMDIGSLASVSPKPTRGRRPIPLCDPGKSFSTR